MTSQVLVSRLKPEYVEVTPAVWTMARSDIMQIEQVSFQPSIRDHVREFFKYIESSTSVFLVLKIRPYSQFAGYIAADSLENFADISGAKSDPHFENHDTIYIESVAIHPHWRRQGLGMNLQLEAMRRARKKGYKRATAHIEHGALARTGFVGKIIASFPNWYGTGRAFDYVELPLGRKI